MKTFWCGVMAVVASATLLGQAPSGGPRTFTGVRDLDIIANLGQVRIEAWARPDVQVDARHSDQVRVEIKSTSTLEIREHRPPRASLERIDYVIHVPAATAIKLWSHSAAVTIRGVRGDLDVHGQHGAIDVAAAGAARLNTTTGSIVLNGARGAVSLQSTAGSITAAGLGGNVTAETVGGRIALTGVTGHTVQATTTGADIEIAGTPQPGGLYDVASQNGTILLRLPRPLDARITYGSVRGQFRSTLPPGRPTAGDDGRTTLMVGDGSARIDLMTFNGDISVQLEPPK
jgi:hypothetical protein